MSESPESIVLLSDFNVSTLHSLLSKSASGAGLQIDVAPFGEVIQPLLNESRNEGAPQRGAVVWASPAGVLPGFTQLIQGGITDNQGVLDEVDRFADMLEASAQHFRFILVVSFSAPPGERGLGMLDLDPSQGISGTLLRANLRLADRLASLRNVYLLDSGRWATGLDGAEEAARLWYLSKTPLEHRQLKLAASEILDAIQAVRGRSRKLIIVDLDDTLWGGIVGDAGWESLRLGGHDPIGEAFVDFQRVLKALARRGVILGIVSKNEESTALDAIKRHPEMVLELDDFAGWRVNWRDKAQNVADLTAEVNVGLDSVVFIDDSASERARVRETLPDVLVPEWPSDPMRYAARLRAMSCFDVTSFSEEDRARARGYAAERRRREAKASVGSSEAWLNSLELKVQVDRLGKADLPRATQLLNKTNQMNLTTRRLTETEHWDWANRPEHHSFTVRVSDRFGDYGLTGLVSCALETAENGKSPEGKIVDFVLSCRVFGRQVERTMLHKIAAVARTLGASRLRAELIPTKKNEPCRRFWVEESGFSQDPANERVFGFALSEPYPAPGVVSLLGDGDQRS